jgi:cysteine desulfurase
VQALLKVPFSAYGIGADLISVSAHKIHGPKGSGALFIRKGVRLPPLLLGGGQEGGLRSGTEPTAQIAAFAAACTDGKAHFDRHASHMEELRRYALELLTAALPELAVVSPGDAPHICAVSLPGYPAEMLVRELSDRGVYVSSGSACHRGKPSHVFAALGLPKRTLMGTLRISVFSRQYAAGRSGPAGCAGSDYAAKNCDEVSMLSCLKETGPFIPI